MVKHARDFLVLVYEHNYLYYKHCFIAVKGAQKPFWAKGVGLVRFGSTYGCFLSNWYMFHVMCYDFFCMQLHSHRWDLYGTILNLIFILNMVIVFGSSITGCIHTLAFSVLSTSIPLWEAVIILLLNLISTKMNQEWLREIFFYI